MRIPVVLFATHNMGSWWDSQGLYGSNPPTEMCEDLTPSATVASHHCAVHVRISLANEVGQTAGVGGLLGRARPAATTERLWESHCKRIRLAYCWASLQETVTVPAGCTWCSDFWDCTALWRDSVTSHWVLGCRASHGLCSGSWERPHLQIHKWQYENETSIEYSGRT